MMGGCGCILSSISLSIAANVGKQEFVVNPTVLSTSDALMLYVIGNETIRDVEF